MGIAQISPLEHRGWRCLRLSGPAIELIVPLDVGPRVLHAALPGGPNLFYEQRESDGCIGGPWQPYGGHRLWHGPQLGYRPNEPDGQPPQLEYLQDGLALTQQVEPCSRIQKRLELHLTPEGARVGHTLINLGVWPVQLTAWALTQMRPDGLALLPLPRQGTQFLPNYALSFWPWTRPNDPRLRWGADFLGVAHDPQNAAWLKLGYGNTRGWAGYAAAGALFVKWFEHLPAADYSDYGASCECFADERFVELESLSAYALLEPGACLTHWEHWQILEGVDMPCSLEAMARTIGRVDALAGPWR